MPTPARAFTTVALVAVAAAGGLLGARWLGDTLSDPSCEFVVSGMSETTTTERAANASTIAWESVERGLAPRAATIAIATAIQESKLQNINYGDADSIGLFQQRPSQGWGTEEEILDPVYSTNAFYDALVEVDGWQDGVITEVAQTVQRSAFPTAYADHEAEGRVMASALTGETAAAVTCDVDAPTGAGDASALADELQGLGMQASSTGASQVTVTGGDVSEAWAIAGWAVTHAQGRQITSVSVDDLVWNRDDNPDVWSRPTPAQDEATVTMMVAP